MTDRFARTDGSTEDCSDLGQYCGGTYKGVIDNLDYIQELGFDALWVSPIPENFEGAYHGYAFKDLYKFNPYFGTEQDFVDLVTELHKRDMWIMVDVVANHAGCLFDPYTYSDVNPFNKEEHYHPECYINDWNNQWEVENCRLACLIDLKQEDPYVAETLNSWIHDLIEVYDVDGLRVDTIPEVPKWYWDEFTAAHGVYAVGEVFNGNIDYNAGYQEHMPSVLNYPIYFASLGIFAYGDSMYKIREVYDEEHAKFKDTSVLGVFMDNHDNRRFLDHNSKWETLTNMIAFTMFAEGIPIFYYGTEQGFHGGDDPDCREPLWKSMNQEHPLYKFTQTVMHTRKDHEAWKHEHVERFVADDFYAFTRGDVLIAVTNTENTISYDVGFLPYSEGTTVCNVFDNSDCLTVGDNGIRVTLSGMDPKIYVPQTAMSEETE